MTTPFFKMTTPFLTRRSTCVLGLFAAVVVVLSSQRTRAESPKQFFSTRVEPILVTHCLECHGSDREANLDLRTKATALNGGEDGPVIVPGESAKSRLYQYVSQGEMPPEKPLSEAEVAVLRDWIDQGAYFPDHVLDRYSRTTKDRAGYDWWSLQPIRRPPLPAPSDPGRIATPIDRFIVARLHQAHLKLSPPVDRVRFIRRVTYDLTGLLPTYEQVQAHVNDGRPDAVQRVVDRLLASPHYGQRWGRHWLDVVRYAESDGFERDGIRVNFWPYRDYVINSFNADKPLDRMIHEQLSGDSLDPNDPQCLIATGFLVAGPKNSVGTISELEKLRTRQDELDEFVSVTGTTFLGLTVGCARCHDHKFDPIRMRDYYSLTAVFGGLDRGDGEIAPPSLKARRDAVAGGLRKQIDEAKKQITQLLDAPRARLVAAPAKTNSGTNKAPPVNFQRNEDRFAPVEAKWIRFIVTETTWNHPCIDELEVFGSDPKLNFALSSGGAIATASSLLPGKQKHQIDHLNDGKYGNSSSWISNEEGGGWAQIQLPETAKVQQVVWGRDRTGEIKDRLAVGYHIDVSLDGKTWKTVSHSDHRVSFASITKKKVIALLTPQEKDQYDKFQRVVSDAEAELKRLPKFPLSYIAQDGKPQPAFVLHRGDVRSRREQVGPAALTAVAGLDPNLRNADGDSGPQRRLQLARWITDRRNPLTARVFVNRVWHYHFGQGLVNTPNDFGFNGDRPSHPQLLDWLADDFLRHGTHIKRLHRMIVLSSVYGQASTFDSQAAVVDGSNRLLWRITPRRIEAESLRDWILQVSGTLDMRMGGPSFRLFRYRDGNVPDYILLDDPGPETWRRAVYMFNIRTFRSPLMNAFDCPDASVQTPKRNHSITALQALSLMNNHFMFEQSRHFAERIKSQAGDDPRQQAAQACRTALLREPTQQQLRTAAAFINEHGLFSLCRVLLNTNEFLYVF